MSGIEELERALEKVKKEVKRTDSERLDAIERSIEDLRREIGCVPQYFPYWSIQPYYPPQRPYYPSWTTTGLERLTQSTIQGSCTNGS